MSTDQRVMGAGGTVPTQAKGRVPTQADEAPAPGKGKKRKLLVVLGAVVVLALGAAAYFFLLAPEEDHAAEVAHEPVELGEVMQIEPVSLNLANGRYLRLGIALQLTAEVHGEVDSARALDQVIALFSGRDIAEVTDPAVRDELKAQLAHQLAETYHGEVVDVYLTEYVTQ